MLNIHVKLKHQTNSTKKKYLSKKRKEPSFEKSFFQNLSSSLEVSQTMNELISNKEQLFELRRHHVFIRLNQYSYFAGDTIMGCALLVDHDTNLPVERDFDIESKYFGKPQIQIVSGGVVYKQVELSSPLNSVYHIWLTLPLTLEPKVYELKLLHRYGYRVAPASTTFEIIKNEYTKHFIFLPKTTFTLNESISGWVYIHDYKTKKNFQPTKILIFLLSKDESKLLEPIDKPLKRRKRYFFEFKIRPQTVKGLLFQKKKLVILCKLFDNINEKSHEVLRSNIFIDKEEYGGIKNVISTYDLAAGIPNEIFATIENPKSQVYEYIFRVKDQDNNKESTNKKTKKAKANSQIIKKTIRATSNQTIYTSFLLHPKKFGRKNKKSKRKKKHDYSHTFKMKNKKAGIVFQVTNANLINNGELCFQIVSTMERTCQILILRKGKIIKNVKSFELKPKTPVTKSVKIQYIYGIVNCALVDPGKFQNNVMGKKNDLTYEYPKFLKKHTLLANRLVYIYPTNKINIQIKKHISINKEGKIIIETEDLRGNPIQSICNVSIITYPDISPNPHQSFVKLNTQRLLEYEIDNHHFKNPYFTENERGNGNERENLRYVNNLIHFEDWREFPKNQIHKTIQDISQLSTLDDQYKQLFSINKEDFIELNIHFVPIRLGIGMKLITTYVNPFSILSKVIYEILEKNTNFTEVVAFFHQSKFIENPNQTIEELNLKNNPYLIIWCKDFWCKKKGKSEITIDFFPNKYNFYFGDKLEKLTNSNKNEHGREGGEKERGKGKEQMTNDKYAYTNNSQRFLKKRFGELIKDEDLYLKVINGNRTKNEIPRYKIKRKYIFLNLIDLERNKRLFKIAKTQKINFLLTKIKLLNKKNIQFYHNNSLIKDGITIKKNTSNF
ncbi:hypothetical protein M0812_14140 [Anaeramoeba flamelloides]|uniref:Uncharacterized protein n=1 Tax=Anaeramoeba flamelloides TaxID=1746091 RepID=A0AAV7ZEM1_9EUKA|nr:hypothetical protein M0812_14140 [Anaeramoeba flamelloides]